MIRVLIADDHLIVRTGLEQLLGAIDGMTIAAMAADGAEAVRLVDELHPDVVLMDLSMPVLDGVGAIKAIKAQAPATRIIVLTSFGEKARIVDALDAGADGYLMKHADPDQLVAAITAVMEGGSPLDPQAARIMLDTRLGRSGDLTDREVEVLRLVREGLANKQIARRLGISERTVKAHLGNVFQRIGVTDRTQAALWARDHLD